MNFQVEEQRNHKKQKEMKKKEKLVKKLKKNYYKFFLIKWGLRILMVLSFIVPFFIYPPTRYKEWIEGLCLFSIGVMGMLFLYIDMKVEKIRRIVKKSIFSHKYEEIKNLEKSYQKNKSKMSYEDIALLRHDIEKKENYLDTLIEEYLKR